MVSPSREMDKVLSTASKSPLVIFTLSTCCMCHAIYSLFAELGANTTVHELDHDPGWKEMEKALEKLLGGEAPPVPAVFVGGKLVGSADTVFTLHLSGRLVALLREAGAL